MAILDTSLHQSIPLMHGMAQIEDLATHFGLDASDLQTEWEGFLEVIKDYPGEKRTLDQVIFKFNNFL